MKRRRLTTPRVHIRRPRCPPHTNSPSRAAPLALGTTVRPRYRAYSSPSQAFRAFRTFLLGHARRSSRRRFPALRSTPCRSPSTQSMQARARSGVSMSMMIESLTKCDNCVGCSPWDRQRQGRRLQAPAPSLKHWTGPDWRAGYWWASRPRGSRPQHGIRPGRGAAACPTSGSALL